jgi:transcriptional regulator with XRE-family HTH domain
LTGAELRAARKAAGLSQIDLANRAGVGRQAVQYHEARDVIGLRGWAIGRIRKVLGADAVPDYPDHDTRARAWAETLLEAERQALDAARIRWAAAEAQRAARRRVICGAKTRKGTPCRCQSEPGKRRCKFHGGMSTGARTPEGKARIAEAQRRRWAKWRAARQD